MGKSKKERKAYLDKLIPQVSKSKTCPGCGNISKLDKTEYCFSKFSYKYDNVYGMYCCESCNHIFASNFISTYKLTNPVNDESNNGVIGLKKNRIEKIKSEFGKLTCDERL